MNWAPGGTYQRGASQPGEYEHEYPARAVEVSGFYMDTCEVTNAQFAKFMEATGYVTVAEQCIDWEEIRQQFAPYFFSDHMTAFWQRAVWFFRPPDMKWNWTTTRIGGLGSQWQIRQGPMAEKALRTAS